MTPRIITNEVTSGLPPGESCKRKQRRDAGLFHPDMLVWVFIEKDTFVACPATCFLAMTREVWFVGDRTLDARPAEAGDVERASGRFCRKRPRLIQAPSGPVLVEG